MIIVLLQIRAYTRLEIISVRVSENALSGKFRHHIET
jgi:hypothetical protein